MRIAVLLLLSAIATCSAFAQAQDRATFHVATNGNNAWSGRLREPNADQSDGPFATVAAARDAVRKGRAGDTAPCPYTVLIRGGFYFLQDTLVFEPQDSGAKDAPITYAAYPGARPILSGGRVIKGWKKGAGLVWTAEIPEVRQGKWYARQLFVNGQRRTRARIPNDNEGFLRSDGPPRFTKEQRDAIAAGTAERKIHFQFKSTSALDKFGFRYKNDDIRRWCNLEDITLHIMHAWTGAVHWIADVDEGRRTVRFTGPSRFPAAHFERQMPYFVENVPEGLDAPGEWYLDRKTGILSYRPDAGEDMAAAETVVSVLQQLVRFDGDPEKGRFVESLVFRGLSFQHADWGPLDREAENDGFSSVHFLEAALGGHGVRHCVFDRCEIARIGGYGLYLLEGSAHNRVQQCEIHDMGGGGILIGSRWSPYDTYKNPLPPDDAPEDRIAHHNEIDNCFIHGGGQIFYGVIGVFVAHSPHNTISHNEICDMPYIGITVGRRLDYKHSHAHHNTVAFNHIHHLGNGVMSDMGGIYTEGVSPGTRLHHNLIHDVNYYRYGAWGVYCDQASSNIQIDHNLCTRCMDGGYMQNVGADNVVRNNIFAFNTRGAQINDGRRRDSAASVDSMVIERNIIHTTNGEVLGYHWDKEDKFQFDYNLYWKPLGVNLKFKDWSWEEWRGMGQDQHSLIADPLFTDAEHDDFRLRPGSAAEKIGFEPVDMSTVGLHGDPEWVARPKRLTFKPFVVMPLPPPDEVQDDFEETPVGERADGAATVGETKNSSICVTDETSAGEGRHSLKFMDGPNVPKPHWPYLMYTPKVSGVIVRLTFDLRVEQGSMLWHEWRTAGQPYKVGPSFRVENGVVTMAGRTLTTLPLGQWVRVEIVSPAKENSDGLFSMSITVPGRAKEQFDKLPLRSGKEFTELRWLAFISMAQTGSVFYIDNIRLEPVQ